MSKEEIEVKEDIEDITLDFFVTKYNGSGNGEDDGRWPISNIFKRFDNLFHCTKEGKNFDLYLEYRKASFFTMTNIAILGAFNCTAFVFFPLTFFKTGQLKMGAFLLAKNQLSLI